MTENEVIVMLAEAIDQDREYKSWHVSTKHLMIFAEMVQKIEREACAKVCDELSDKRPWVGLTRNEQSFVYSSLHDSTSRKDSFWVDFANAIEAKLKEKNYG